MPKFEFASTRGWTFSEDGRDVWAKFVRDPTATGRSYRFGTDDAKTAARVRAVTAHHITETTKPRGKAHRGDDADTG